MGFEGDNLETLVVQKELDIIVDATSAKAFRHPNDILPKYAIQGSFNGAYVQTFDGVGRLLIINSKKAHGNDSLKQRRDLIEQFEEHKINTTPEFTASKCSYISFKKSLELATKHVQQLLDKRKTLSSYSPSEKKSYCQKITRELALNLEKIAFIQYGNNFHHISILGTADFGIRGSILLNSWTSQKGGKSHGQFVKPITDPSQIYDIKSPRVVGKKLSWENVRSLARELKPELTPSLSSTKIGSNKKITDQDLEHISKSGMYYGKICPSPMSYLGVDQSFNRYDSSSFTRLQISSTKIATSLLASASLLEPSLSQSSDKINIQQPESLKRLSLGKPSSAPNSPSQGDNGLNMKKQKLTKDV